MDSLCSSLIPKYPQTNFKVSSLRNGKNPQTKINANICFFEIFQPITKLITRTKEPIIQNPTTPRNKQSFLQTVFNKIDDLVTTSIDTSTTPFIDPKHVLSGNFAPVDELPPTACEVVEGSLPLSLNGAYIRNGPNPQFVPRGPYHVVDGDGMLHSITITNGKATFCSRYVETYKYKTEHKIGHPIFPNTFAAFNKLTATLILTVARVLTLQFNPVMKGLGIANTSLALIAGKLYALCESDLPYAIKITSNGDIVTLGRHDFYSDEFFMNMTAHLKIDHDTNETFAFRYFIIPPFLTFFRIDANGRKQKDVPIYSLKGAVFMHDFAVTKSYAIFPDPQIVLELMGIMRGRSIMRVDIDKMPRVGVIERYAEDEEGMVWIESPGLNLLHTINSWDDGDDRVVIIASNVLCIEHALERMNLIHLSLEKVVIDIKEKKVLREPLSIQNLDFGVINPEYAGKKNRYVYASPIEVMPKMSGAVKIDLSLVSAPDCRVSNRTYGPGCYGSELIFVPREPNNPEAEEDDGYLLTYVHNENTQESHFLVMDAKSPSLEIVALVKLPQRVPYGFHAIFVKETDLNKL